MVQWVKALALLQLWHRLQLQLTFDPWPRNFHILQVWPTKKKIKTQAKKKKNKKKENNKEKKKKKKKKERR